MMKMKDMGYYSEISQVLNAINTKLSNPLPQYEIDMMLRGKGLPI